MTLVSCQPLCFGVSATTPVSATKETEHRRKEVANITVCCMIVLTIMVPCIVFFFSKLLNLAIAQFSLLATVQLISF